MYARAVVAVVLVLATITVLAGCAGEDLSGEGIANAAQTTASKGGARIALQQTIGTAGGGSLSTRGTGVIDSRTQTGRLTLRTSGGPGLPPALARGTTQDVIIDRFTIYLRSPLLASVLPSGKRWLKIDVDKLGETIGIDVSMLAQSAQDPSQSMQLLEAVSGDVEKLGEEQVRGVDTTHYRATVDLRKYPSVVPAGSRAAARATIDKTIELTGMRMVPVEVWIDGDDVVRRFEQKLTLGTAGDRVPFSQRIELYDFGTRVDVTPPPAREVRDVADVAASGLAGSGSSSSLGTQTP
jgi:hypothetical protein